MTWKVGSFNNIPRHAGDMQWDNEPSAGDAFVAPNGDDANDATAEAPVATVEEAMQAIDGEPATIWLRGGIHRRSEPLQLRPRDVPLRIAAYPDEQPVITGATVLTDWEETTINGVDCWRTSVESDRTFRTLFVDGERRHPPRLPKAVDAVFDDDEIVRENAGRFYAFESAPDEDGARRFRPEPGSIDPTWHDLESVDVVTMAKWYDERAPIEDVTVDADGQVTDVTLAFRPYDTKEWPGRIYYVENVREALTEPGEFYLDRETAECYYVPYPDETLDAVTITAPHVRELVRIVGDPIDRPVTNLTLSGLTIAETDWAHWQRPDWITGQSAAPTTAAVRLRGVKDLTIEDCTISTVGEYGLALREGCRGISIQGCEFADLGAGAIKLGSYANDPHAADARTERIQILDNHLHHGGRVFHLGAGILAMDVSRVRIAYNHIHDFYYTGVSCGWNWGYADSVAWENTIERNHIHDLGKRLLSDMGGVYTLGVQPGTTITGNRIHDVRAREYGAWGIYPDEGSSHILVEGNLVYDVDNEPFGQHFGRENIVRHNVFAFGGTGIVRLSRAENHVAFTCERNVFLTDGAPVVTDGYGWSVADAIDGSGPPGIISDLNVWWRTDGEAPTVGDGLSFDDWQAAGFDRHATVTDPGVTDATARDFRPNADSPLHEWRVDCSPLDPATVGPRR